jgi:predicted AlkP superfamily phosphohydrolase/phosphomutase
VIKDFYKLYDKVIGRYLDAISSDVVIIVFSDHGHCMRPVKLVNINELLRKKGYLVAKGNKPGKFGIEKLKRDLFGVMTKYKLGQLALKVLYAFPEIKKIYTAPPSIDFMKTYAHISDLSGIKAYSYGGIKIRKENIKDIGYEQLRNILVNELCNIKDPDTGENLVRWVRKREDLYQGIYISEYPDIVFELNENYGAGWAIYEPLITTSYSHNIHPGSHRAETPIFLLSNLEGKECVRENMTLTDVAPTILDLLHIKNDFDFDGKSIFRE